MRIESLHKTVHVNFRIYIQYEQYEMHLEGGYNIGRSITRIKSTCVACWLISKLRDLFYLEAFHLFIGLYTDYSVDLVLHSTFLTLGKLECNNVKCCVYIYMNIILNLEILQAQFHKLV